MALIDEAVVCVEGGAGGNGCISFRREKYIPRGGPNGGNGGNGGSIFLKATHNKSSLLDFRFQPKYKGERGEHGLGSDMYGRAGEDQVIEVPVGTLIFDIGQDLLIADLNRQDSQVCIAHGGRGGRGNLSFKSSTNRAPRMSTPGKPGQARQVKLELRLVADVGLVGLPNAGKSSFLSTVTRAKPKIANYPFTTLEPHLGVVDHRGHSFVIADLPGLIEGASDGAGLGHKFLKHVTRNRILLHMVDVSSTVEQIKTNIEVIRNEMNLYDPTLMNREEFLVFTKTDLLEPAALAERKKELEENGISGFYISSHTHEGLNELLTPLEKRCVEWHLENAKQNELLIATQEPESIEDECDVDVDDFIEPQHEMHV